MEGKDLTKGKLLKNMTILLIPLVMTNLLNSIYNIVDGIWIGNLIGENGVSAITNCYPLTLIVASIATGLAVATSVLVSQYYGAKQEEKLKSVMGVAYITTFIIGIVTAILMIATSTIWLKILNTPKEILDITRQYLIIYVIGFIFNYLLTIIMEALRAIGNSKVPLVFVGITTTINLILDPILIKLGLGVAGAGIATLIAMFIGAIIAVLYVNRKSELLKVNFKYLKFTKEYVKPFLKTGLPVIIEEWFIAGVILLEVNISNATGVIGSASYGVVSKLEQVVMVIGASFKTMATVTVGQFIGNKQVKESVKVMKQGLKIVSIPTILIILIVFVFPRQFCKIFVSSEDVISTAIMYLSVVGISHILLPTRQLLQGFILGTGHTKFVLFTSTLASIVEIITIVVLRNTNIDNLVVLGIGILLFVITKIILETIYFFSNKWQQEVIEK